MFRDKSRIRVCADADIVVFDSGELHDRATYEDPDTPSAGFRSVLVNGVPVVEDGTLMPDRYAGRRARAPQR